MKLKQRVLAYCALAASFALGAGFIAGSGTPWVFEVFAKRSQPAFRVISENAGAMLEVTPIKGGVLFRAGDLEDNYGGAALIVADDIILEGRTLSYGDVLLPSADYGVIFTSPNGSHWRMTIDDSGEVVVSSLVSELN